MPRSGPWLCARKGARRAPAPRRASSACQRGPSEARMARSRPPSRVRWASSLKLQRPWQRPAQHGLHVGRRQGRMSGGEGGAREQGGEALRVGEAVEAGFHGLVRQQSRRRAGLGPRAATLLDHQLVVEQGARRLYPLAGAIPLERVPLADPFREEVQQPPPAQSARPDGPGAGPAPDAPRSPRPPAALLHRDGRQRPARLKSRRRAAARCPCGGAPPGRERRRAGPSARPGRSSERARGAAGAGSGSPPAARGPRGARSRCDTRSASGRRSPEASTAAAARPISPPRRARAARRGCSGRAAMARPAEVMVPSGASAPSRPSRLSAASRAASGGGSSQRRWCASRSPAACRSRQSWASSRREISGASCSGRERKSASVYRRTTAPGPLRPARPARCRAEAREMRRISTRARPLQAESLATRARPLSHHPAHAPRW